MWRWSVIACLLGFFTAGLAQTSASGSVSGTVLDQDGAVVVDAPVQLRNTTTGSIARILSSAAGQYAVTDLAAGTYEVSIVMPCCAFRAFKADSITLQTGQALRLDIRLEQGITLGTLGDDPAAEAAFLRRRAVIPKQAVPRLPDGKPDLSGLWIVNDDLYPEEPVALPWAAALAKERVENEFKDAPHTRCLPEGLPVPSATAPFMGKFVHTPSLLVILFEDSPGYRQIFLDGREHPTNWYPSWLGHSTATWDGDTLVVSTIGFNDRGWVDIYPRTEQLRMTERYSRPDFGHLQVRATFDDPGAFSRPWSRNMVWDLLPQEELLEYVCEVK
jgi:hypothetical protein